STQGPGGGQSTLNMTAAAIGSMSIAAMYLFPDQSERNVGLSGPKRPKTDPSGLKFGILERELPPEPEADPADTPSGAAKPVKPQGPYKIQTTYAEYKQHTQRALGWLGGNFQVHNRVGPAMYYYYSLERMGALTKVDKLGSHDWYEECADYLVQQQQDEGSWTFSVYDGNGPYVIGTSFGILFLTRSTAKLLNRLPRSNAIGGGLLVGGRGLPEDLSHVDLADGRVEARKPSGPLDELLSELSKAGGDGLFELQEQIVEKIQLGDRSELVGQTEQLVKLVDHPDPQIRRTALWALGRSDDLGLVRHAIRALLDDPDADVLVEAHNALGWFARRPDGFGVPDNPFTGVPPDASDEVRTAALAKWREQAVQAWGQWYLRICPYEERDDPFVVALRLRMGNRP
ncbi:MAG: HEAT repeat domain-containing protein, partial [Planctomycetaceae bacterium]